MEDQGDDSNVAVIDKSSTENKIGLDNLPNSSVIPPPPLKRREIQPIAAGSNSPGEPKGGVIHDIIDATGRQQISEKGSNSREADPRGEGIKAAKDLQARLGDPNFAAGFKSAARMVMLGSGDGTGQAHIEHDQQNSIIEEFVKRMTPKEEAGPSSISEPPKPS